MNFLKRLNPVQIIVLGYLFIILIGTIFLAQSFVSVQGIGLSLIDAFFTATSAVSVTGLLVVDTGTFFNVWGELIILILLQIGGLGYMVFVSIFILILKKRFSLKNRMAVQESTSLEGVSDTRGAVLNILKVVFTLELVMGFIFFLAFHQNISLFDSYFQIISAFCNAGFSTIDFMLWKDNLLFNTLISIMIITGGLGYFVISDIRARKLSLHSKLALIVTFVLLVVGTLVFFLVEDISFMQAIFTAVTARTAGFSTVDLGLFHSPSLIGLIVLMFIGASPGGTGGGIKTVTFAILVVSGASFLRGNERPAIFRRSIEMAVFQKAFLIFFLTLTMTGLFTFLISSLEPTLSLVQVFFEVVSALGTVGLSLGITAQLLTSSKLLLIFLMLLGRVGVFMITAALFHKKEKLITFPEESVRL